MHIFVPSSQLTLLVPNQMIALFNCYSYNNVRQYRLPEGAANCLLLALWSLKNHAVPDLKHCVLHALILLTGSLTFVAYFSAR